MGETDVGGLRVVSQQCINVLFKSQNNRTWNVQSEDMKFTLKKDHLILDTVM